MLEIMKKYKLKKDLPTWKAGTIFWIWEDECLYGLSEDNKPIMVYSAITLINFDLLKNSEWFEEVEEEKSIFELDYGDKYFYIDDFSEVKEAEVENETFENDLNYGNVFLTKEEAEKELRKREAIMKIKKYCWENDIEIEYNREKSYIITYDFVREKFIYTYLPEIMPVCPFYFNEIIKTERIIENCKKDLKIIFDV